MRIVIADDHPLVRSGIRASLAREADFQVVAEASSGDEALKTVVEQQPDLLILDVSMPGLPPDQVISEARKSVPDLKTLIVTAFDDDVYVRRLSQVAISGYLLKDEAPDHLVQAVRVIQQGAVWFSQAVASKIMSFSRRQADSDQLQLNERDRGILERIARGLDNLVIARELNLAEQTVRNYASALYQKLGVKTRVEAVVWARDHGIV